MSPGNDSRDHRRSSAPSLDAAVTEAMIHDLVHAFYARVRQDAALGPIFHRAVRDWDAHLSKLCDFWSAIMLGTGRFKGAPVAVHAQLPAVHAAHFAQWLLLFRQTAWEACPRTLQRCSSPARRSSPRACSRGSPPIVRRLRRRRAAFARHLEVRPNGRALRSIENIG